MANDVGTREIRETRELLNRLMNSGVKGAKICEVVFGSRDKQELNRLYHFKGGATNTASICVAIYEKLPELWKLTRNEEVHAFIETMKSDDNAPTYANHLRRTYQANLDDMAEAGGFWQGSYIAYRHDPKTAGVLKSTLDVSAYSPTNKGIPYRHARHDTDIYVVKGWLVPTRRTYCFFGQSYREQADSRTDKPHGGVVTIFVNRPTPRDREIWDQQQLRFLQGLIMISLPDDTYPAFTSRILFLRKEEAKSSLDYAKPWETARKLSTAIAEIDAAMYDPSVGPGGSIASHLLSNRLDLEQDCLVSYKNPVP